MGRNTKTRRADADTDAILNAAREFSRRMRQRRERLRLTQHELSRKVGVSLTTIQNYEGGQFPKGEHAIMLALALQISLDELLLGQPGERAAPGETTMLCEHCRHLKTVLEQEQAERRELSLENRQLWKENGDLRERLARLERGPRGETP